MAILLISEHDQNNIKPAFKRLLTAAKQIDSTIDVLVLGQSVAKIADHIALLQGIRQVIVNTQVCYDHVCAEPIADLIGTLKSDYTHIFGSSSSFGKAVIPRVAALCDVSPISDIVQIHDPTTFTRPIYAGNAYVTVKVTAPIIIGTVRCNRFDVSTQMSDSPAKIIENQYISNEQQVEFIEETLSVADRPELTSANIIVSGGRGFQSKENLEKLLFPLADKLNAAVGATRAIVDAGFIENDYQVGQTGKQVSPDLYIAIGLSGQIQHIAGMKDSKVVVAINTDPDAPIMQVADYALQQDLFEVIPELISLL